MAAGWSGTVGKMVKFTEGEGEGESKPEVQQGQEHTQKRQADRQADQAAAAAAVPEPEAFFDPIASRLRRSRKD